MVLVRGINGRLKLHPGLAFWSGLALIALLLVGSLVWQIVDRTNKVEACEAQGGVWLGGALAGGFCEFESEEAG